MRDYAFQERCPPVFLDILEGGHRDQLDKLTRVPFRPRETGARKSPSASVREPGRARHNGTRNVAILFKLNCALPTAVPQIRMLGSTLLASSVSSQRIDCEEIFRMLYDASPQKNAHSCQADRCRS